jgi:hypothetical protein
MDYEYERQQMENPNTRFQNLPDRSDFSPSGVTSNFSERDMSPPHQQESSKRKFRASQHPSHITSKSKVTKQSNRSRKYISESGDQVVMGSNNFDNSQNQGI